MAKDPSWHRLILPLWKCKQELYAAGIVDSTSPGQYGVRRVARHRARKNAMSNRLPLNLDQFKLIPKVWLTANLSCLCMHVLAISFVARAGSLPCVVLVGIGNALSASSWQSFGGGHNPEWMCDKNFTFISSTFT